MEIKYPEGVKEIIEIYKKYGERAYAVGGCVRDVILGREPDDWDITVSATPQRTIEIFERENIRTAATGLKHGTVSVILDGDVFECTTHRVDGEYKDSRHPEGVIFTERLEDDLSRRDFTVNAIAASPDGGIFDVFGGIEDIKNKIIRCVGDPRLRLSEDALRILRAVRFATVLGFEIEDDTICAIREMAHLLTNISRERRTAELKKILVCGNADRGISMLFETGVMKYLLPDAVEGEGSVLRVEGSFSARLACLMHDTGANDMSCLCLSCKERSDVKALLRPLDEYDIETCTETVTETAARRVLSRLGELTFAACGIWGRSELGAMARQQSAAGAIVTVKQLCVGGKDLLEMGVPPQKIGDELSRMLDEVIEHPWKNKREILLGEIGK